jgi:hypothetical protein
MYVYVHVYVYVYVCIYIYVYIYCVQYSVHVIPYAENKKRKKSELPLCRSPNPIKHWGSLSQTCVEISVYVYVCVCIYICIYIYM